MKKASLFSLLLLFFLSSCSHLPQTEDRPHELVEVTVEDSGLEMDEELSEEAKLSLPSSGIPFLINKNNKRVHFWVNYFLEKDRERFQRFINNGEEYRHNIEEIFESYGLPKELYYVGFIESGYNLEARSWAKAVGPWQFIRGTGKRYGLKISSEIDERQDLFKSTHAAAQYLKDLNNVFYSWELALAAYNAGEYGILRRIMKHKTRDYYELSRHKYLPKETINYVPKVLAAMHIVSNARKYGFNIPKKDIHLFDNTELLKVRKNHSLFKLARKMKIDYRDLKRLNPALRKNKTPKYYSGTYKLRIPIGLGKMLDPSDTRESRREVIRRTASIKSYHRVKRGETLLRVARRYNTSAGKLARLNNFKTWRTTLRVGQKLIVSGKASRPIIYKVKRGDNLSTLARLFNGNTRNIRKANGLKSNKLYVGQKIILPNTKKGIYTVKPGDHLIKISRKFNQPLEAILKLNALKQKKIYPGQKLVVDID
jgi:membrane-bound lytic murein transglycosylase D